MLRQIKTLENAAVQEESLKQRLWAEKNAEIEALKKRVLDLNIDHSAVEQRIENVRAQFEKVYEEKSSEIHRLSERRLLKGIERAAHAQFERLHDMTVLKNRFVRRHESKIERVKAELEEKENEIKRNEKTAEAKIDSITHELQMLREDYAEELKNVSNVSSARALEIERLKDENESVSEKERNIANELKKVQTNLFKSTEKTPCENAAEEEKSSETKFREVHRLVQAERNALYALTQSEFSKAKHKSAHTEKQITAWCVRASAEIKNMKEMLGKENGAKLSSPR